MVLTEAPGAAAARRRPFLPLLRQRLRGQAVQVAYRVAGLPIAARALVSSRRTPDEVIRRAYARRYWRPARPSDWAALVLGLLLWPPVLIVLALLFVRRNGSIVARRSGRPLHLQFLDQFRLYFEAGLLPPWYYMFDLYRNPDASCARSYIYRWESKGGVLPMLRQEHPPASDLADKVAFAESCRRGGIPTIPVLAVAKNGTVHWLGSGSDRAADWFVKPIEGKGGKGIERWDHVGEERFRSSRGELLHRDQLLERIAAQSMAVPRFIQPRIENHRELQDLGNGALATTRALTCLNERGEPELVGAVLRMAVGRNHVVDNFHAGGIAAAIDLATGELGPASNLGTDARLGWLDKHPDSGAAIRGRRFPLWDEFGAFVENAHRSFSDRALIGWDVAATPAGLVVVEANGSPDLDIMQRSPRRGLMSTRFAELLAHRLESIAGSQ